MRRERDINSLSVEAGTALVYSPIFLMYRHKSIENSSKYF
ncbi:hypothetical protein HMPREF1554_00815 [Porphyromonas gingivalis F0569]|nr:hypothetical protein HMPREF1554_00815 [Porphyromonas gingivalis F0569]